MEATDIQPWLFRVEPFEGESRSHFLGRFRRVNDLTPSGLGKVAKIGAAIARWEKFRFNPSPSRQQLEALAVVVGVEADRLAQMLPPVGAGMKHEPIRLCGAVPCHQIEWQFKVTQGCGHHQLRLLSECPNCGARFKIPALWIEGVCQGCFLPFGEMMQWQKNIQK